MSAELLIFVGYSQDAKEEALAIRELIVPLQEMLKNFNRVAMRPAYSTLDIFHWEAKADVGVGGQDFAIAPHLEQAAIAIFVFKEKVGLGTWQELNHCRNRPLERRIPTFALFPANPPSSDRLGNREVARSWTELLDRKHELTEGWADQESNSVTPLELYQDKQHLKEILRSKLADLFPALVKGQSSAYLEENVTASLALSETSNNQYLDSLSPLTQYDAQSIQQYRSQVRDNKLAAPDLSDDEFLSRMGYQKAGRLTIAAALLFTKLPSRVIPSAIVRCSKYDGENKSTPRNRHNCDGPLLEQIIQARAFIEVNIDRRERPIRQSMRSEVSFEYPMICVREILANAVCHRSYEDQERLIYVTLFTDRIEIKSPGPWASTIILEGKSLPLSLLAGESVQRNMRLAQAISSVGMMEVEGSGIPSAIRDCAEVGAPEPTVEMRAGYVVVTIFPRGNWDSEIDGELYGDEEGVSLAAGASQGPSIHVAPEQDRVIGRTSTDAKLIVGLEKVMALVARVAQTDATVLISGETGTGKELVARSIHVRSSRKDKPFTDVNCGGIPETLIESELFGFLKGTFTGADRTRKGLIESANEGTLFLDEVDALSPAIQAKLLRVLQERRFRSIGSRKDISVDVRIIATTNRELSAMVAEGSFRKDLYFRLNVVEIKLPPLRERRQEIEPLAQHFIDRYGRRVPGKSYRISNGAMQLLMNYDWPGNVRELENTIEAAIALSSEEVLSEADFRHLMIANERAVEKTASPDEADKQQDWNPS